jgi:hypothetical protein
MVTLRAKLADASRRLADLLARYNTRHPAVVKVEAEIRDIERSIAAEKTQRNPGSGFDPTFNPSATVAVPIPPPIMPTRPASRSKHSVPERRWRASISSTYSCAAPCGPAILVTQDPNRIDLVSVRISGRYGIFRARAISSA